MTSDPRNETTLSGQTVVVIGGSSGVGFETARQARQQGAEVVLTGRDAGRLERAARALEALSSAAFDATDASSLERFFADLTTPIDHLMVTAGGSYYAPLAELDDTQVRAAFDQHLFLPLQVARNAAGKVRPGGTLLFMTGTAARRPGIGNSISAILAAGVPALTANLAVELAPIRVNLIAAGFIDTPLSASVLGDGLEERRRVLRATLPIGRVVEPEDVAALAIHLMLNSALTGSTYDVDGGQQLLGG